MPEFLKDRREAYLFCSAWVCFALLLVVKIKLPVPHWMSSPKWAEYVQFFQSKVLEDIAGDLLTGLIAAYFFYVVIDIFPRLKKEADSKRILNLLIAAVMDSYDKIHWFGHAMSITQVDNSILTIGNIDGFIEEIESRPNISKLKCALFTAHSRFADFEKTLSIAALLGPAEVLQWLVITDKIRIFTEQYENHPQSDLYTLTSVLNPESAPEIDRDVEAYVEFEADVLIYQQILQVGMTEFLIEARNWIAPGQFTPEPPLGVNDTAIRLEIA